MQQVDSEQQEDSEQHSEEHSEGLTSHIELTILQQSSGQVSADSPESQMLSPQNVAWRLLLPVQHCSKQLAHFQHKPGKFHMEQREEHLDWVEQSLHE